MKTVLSVGLLALLPLAGCAPQREIRIDGSRTLTPLSEAVAKVYRRLKPAVRVHVGVATTALGLNQLCAGEIEIAEAARPISPEEDAFCVKSAAEYIELPVAYDAIAVVANAKNDWITGIHVTELKKIWEPQGRPSVSRFREVRATWPGRAFRLCGALPGMATYEYFAEAIVGRGRPLRDDMTATDDTGALVRCVAGDEGALGFLRRSDYALHANELRLVAVTDVGLQGDDEAVLPTRRNVDLGLYQPLSLPLFLYVSKAALLRRPDVEELVTFYLRHGADVAAEMNYIPLPATAYALAEARVVARTSGTVFEPDRPRVRVPIDELLAREKAQSVQDQVPAHNDGGVTDAAGGRR